MGKTVRSSQREGSSVAADLAEFLQSLARSLLDPYRPELHYMRGPGPKWHAKHDRAPAGAIGAIPALVRGAREGLILDDSQQPVDRIGVGVRRRERSPDLGREAAHRPFRALKRWP